ncbi:hypothetical protein C1645_747141 [Glomus cerebriforme]|uniref:Uncharacterized protein n=1 Tax=Glomus cerebriforme TaxID=658196 RepID=A0A397TXL1_9GLOM|nr:hypothetical protein C1645_747141 [Glomus cerebriforme]
MARPQSSQIVVGPSIKGYSGGSGSGGGNFFTRFLREEIFAQDKRPGNLDILISTGLFAATIAFLKNYGSELLAV